MRGSIFHYYSMKFVLQNLVSLILFLNYAESLFFNFTSFNQDSYRNISYKNDSDPINGVIQLTRSTAGTNLQASVGRASYNRPVRLWDKRTSKKTNFTTHFSFIIKSLSDKYIGDGMTFFIAPFDDFTEYAPENSAGESLGLAVNVTNKYPFVAVEFDTFYNSLIDPIGDHIGIDVTSIVSEVNVTVDGGLNNRSTAANSWITYDSVTNNLSVFLTYDDHPVFSGESSLFHIIDLSSILPETVRIGFTAATGANIELHTILSWDFNSTLEDTYINPAPQPTFHSSVIHRQSNSKGAMIGGVVAGVSVLIIGLGLVVFMRGKRGSKESHDDVNFDMDEDFDQGTGPRKFTYNELIQATSNFLEEGMLGQGGFGGVYKGFLSDVNRSIAVKKISRGSKQGKKEYMSEVKVISRLRHKNLVQLLGWCHDRGELLLVYEFLTNGSLDFHLYADKRKMVLPWVDRYKIAHGLASALLYLHEEWDQCVLHRDIKSSNVMLDSNFNAKLGDFGLARLVDHNLGSQTTVLAGTIGYLAPECFMTGKFSKESDVYSFGVVALEIACGRRPVESMEELHKVNMIEWVWHLYGEGRLLDAADKTLEEGEFDIQEMEVLMIVGLWCCHPEYTFRPTIRQVISVLNKESPLPQLPTKFPVPIYTSPPTYVEPFYISSSSGLTGSSTTGTTTSSSSHSAVSGTTPLLVQNATV